MSEKGIQKLILILAAITMVGFGASASAHMGAGYGYNPGWHHGAGMHHQGYECQAYGYQGENFTESEIKQMQAENGAFFEATREIRAQIYQKRLELRSELAKKEPNPEKAVGLQKQISELKAQMGLKRLNHILKLKKINPDVGRGLMGRGGYGMMGPGMMGPGMMGPGGSGRGDTRQYHGMQSSPAE